MARVKKSEKSSCYLFIDNSYVFIEGKKFCANKLRLNVPTDKRFRIDIGKLYYALVEGREVKSARLYGSEPPALDSVWETIKQNGIQVTKYCRNIKDKEKKVDGALIVHATACCIENKASSNNGTFIIVAGDSDFTPLIEIILATGWKVEIVSFSSSISGDLKKPEDESVCIRYMDDIVWDKKRYFINKRHKSKTKRVPRERTMVALFASLPNTAFDSDADILIEKITNIFKFPCVYSVANNKKDIFIIICQRAKPHTKKSQSDKEDTQQVKQKPLYDFTQLWRSNEARIKTECKDIFSTYKFERFLTLVDYLQKFGQNEDPDLQLTNKFESIGLDDDDSSDDEGEAMEMEATTITDDQDENIDQDNQERSDKENKDEDNNEEHNSDAIVSGWTVKAPKPKNVKTGLYSDPCKYKFGCLKRGKCGWQHTVDEQRYFKHHGTGTRGYKSKPCTRFDCPYKKDSVLCPYAHSENEARCYECHQIGHYQSVKRCGALT
jgi:uncharacterized LabA/DUF88 family protein